MSEPQVNRLSKALPPGEMAESHMGPRIFQSAALGSRFTRFRKSPTFNELTLEDGLPREHIVALLDG
jgi:hypothetical protein